VSFFVTCFFGKKTGFFGHFFLFLKKVTFLTLFFEISNFDQFLKISKRLFQKVPKSPKPTFSGFDQIPGFAKSCQKVDPDRSKF